jgi:hypothetical protein
VIKLKPHSSILQPGTPFYLTEREVTPIGVTVRKYFRRTRSTSCATPARRHPREHATACTARRAAAAARRL